MNSNDTESPVTTECSSACGGPQRLLIHGIHVHVGVRSGDKAVITTNVLAMYLP